MRFTVKLAFVLCLSAMPPVSASAQRLFVGLEDGSLATRSSNLAGFPIVTWTNHFAFEVNGAACAPDGRLYLCQGPFTTQLYRSTLAGPPQFVATTTVDLHGLGYGRGQLYGFSNFASPMGIYRVDPLTGAATLLFDTTTPGFRFFGLDYNPIDDHLYGYTEYGVSGLYRIDLDTGVMTRLTGTPPGVNGQGRALAVGNDTVYLLATRGDDGEPCFAYALAQGVGGNWTAFTNPYPAHHNTGGATWIPPAGSSVGDAGAYTNPVRLAFAGEHPAAGEIALRFEVPAAGEVRLEIFDLSGRRTAVLLDRVVEAGENTITWDRGTARGDVAAAGVYFARLSAPLGESALRFVLVP